LWWEENNDVARDEIDNACDERDDEKHDKCSEISPTDAVV